MQVTISKHDLLSMITKIQGAVSPKPPIPILSNILLETTEDDLILTATDTLLTIVARAKARISGSAKITIPAKRFFPLIREITAPEIAISVESDTMIIKAGTSQFKILGISAENYPTPVQPHTTHQTSFPSALLKEMLAKTTFATTRDPNQPLLSGISIERKTDTAVFTATDGKRIAIVTAAMPESPWQGSLILPAEIAQKMISVFEEEESATLSFSHDKLFLETQSVFCTAQLISGQYPDPSILIPQKGTTLKIHREELISLLKQVSLFTSKEWISVRFSFSPGNLTLSIANDSTGEGVVSMPVNYSGTPFETAFSPSSLLEILCHSKDEIVDFLIEGPFSPGKITDSSQATFVVMPMRLQQ